MSCRTCPRGSISESANPVRCRPLPARTSRGSPNAARKRPSVALIAGCPTLSRSAARLTLCSVSKASKATSEFISKLASRIFVSIQSIHRISNRMSIRAHATHIVAAPAAEVSPALTTLRESGGEEMPERLLSSIAHVELLTPDLDASVEYARDVLGLDVVLRVDDSVYLRCWGDYYRYSLVLTSADRPGLGHVSWRAEGEDQLNEAVRRIEASGLGGDWHEGSFGHGRAYRFTGPGGHRQEIFWDVELAVAPPGEESTYPERPQRAAVPRGRGPYARPRYGDESRRESLGVMDA